MDKPKIEIAFAHTAFIGFRPCWFYFVPRVVWAKDEYGWSFTFYWLIFFVHAERIQEEPEEQHGIWLKKSALEEDGPTCYYPDCNCPFDAPADPDWCARGFKHGKKGGR